MVSIIDGNKIAQDIRNEVRQSATSNSKSKKELSRVWLLFL